MKNFQDKRTRRRLLYSHASILALIVVIGLLAHAVWDIYQKRELTEVSRSQAERELAFLRSRSDSLHADVERLSSKKGAEAELRTKFQVAKPGEEVIVVVDDASRSEDRASIGASGEKGFWKVLKALFTK